ncbi:septum site-determining protein MinC [Serpentinicella sp. ANB-PHB4]|uniref:septum site-determining protein MinC n=1 Tax=Serpentinicella sp. ANB-PHB4 TaxID=3074076 RepID=UPI0028559C27|nr:septum site-determining protein MinC [Serpentinicella sp. ANB-PHB4]MDR5657891.1 septum site-determining protein MinC [Serpentinicella sp. ANB-PHB4]
MIGKDIIEFKGTKNGIYIHIKPDLKFEKIEAVLIEKMEKAKCFFKGAKICDIKCDTLSEEEKRLLKNIMVSQYEMDIENKTPDIIEEDINQRGNDEIFTGITEGKTKFIKGTVRSGQRLYYEGNIVILGDVNPGAQIIALGNIIVMGTLRGIAHAGANGNQEAVVVAIHLDPTQLRIADFIARPPDGDYEKPSVPELAKIKSDTIYIEPYLLKK